MDKQAGEFLDYKLLTGFTAKDSGQEHRFIAYVGNSMNPTLREPELMEVTLYHGDPIRRGDVIYFTPQGETHAVVHRVIRISGQDIFTRGDNNPSDDGWILSESQVAGRVTAAWCGPRQRMIRGGWQGFLLGKTWHGLHRLEPKLSRRLGPLYQWLSARGFVFRLLPQQLRIRIVQFHSGGQERLFLFWGKQLIGRHVNGEWLIRRPFRLIVNEHSLVGNHPEANLKNDTEQI